MQQDGHVTAWTLSQLPCSTCITPCTARTLAASITHTACTDRDTIHGGMHNRCAITHVLTRDSRMATHASSLCCRQQTYICSTRYHQNGIHTRPWHVHGSHVVSRARAHFAKTPYALMSRRMLCWSTAMMTVCAPGHSLGDAHALCRCMLAWHGDRLSHSTSFEKEGMCRAALHWTLLI